MSTYNHVQHVVSVNEFRSIADLNGLIGSKDGDSVYVAGYYESINDAPWVKGGGHFVWDSTKLRTKHNGVTIISPTVQWDNTPDTLSDYHAGTLEIEPSGAGCWVRQYEILNVHMAGAVGDGVVDDTTAIQAALTYTVANVKTLFIPDGVYLTSSTLNVTGKWSIVGEGPLSRVKTTDTTIPLFTFDINTKTVLHGYIGNIHFLGPQTSTATSCALRFIGDATSYVQFCTFENLWCTEFNAFMKDEKLPRTTVHGLEAMLNWNIWSNIHIYNTTTYGFWCTNGSGTGNTWSGIKAVLRGALAPIWFFGGSGCVVGDVAISGAHLSGRDASGSVGVKIGDDTVYRSRFSITGCQFDAGCLTPVALSSVGSAEYNNWIFANNNVGGNAPLGDNLQYMSRSVLSDKDVDRREAGRTIATSSTGSITNNCFFVDLDTNASVTVTIGANGHVGGVGAITSEYVFSIRTDGVTMLITELESALSATTQGVITCTSSSANRAIIKVSYVPTDISTLFSVIAMARGYNYKLTITTV